MGLTKQYLRYAPQEVFNVVASSKANVVFVQYRGVKGKLCAVGACEHVVIWNPQTGEKLATLEGEKHEVTQLVASPDSIHLCVGYSDGAIRIFNTLTGNVDVLFNGHKSAVTALNYDKDGARLVSGSRDKNVIVWDIINESGLYRLLGHKGTVTQARFLSVKNVLVTSSQDTYLKFWDLDTQHCFKTAVGHKTDIWDFVVVKNETRIVTGSSDNELRVWNLDPAAAPAKRIKLESIVADSDGESEDADKDDEDSDSILKCEYLGSLARIGKSHVVSMSVDETGRMFGCHGNDKCVELFRVNTDAEIKKHVQKRAKRVKKKAKEAGENESDLATDEKWEDSFQVLDPFYAPSKVKAFQSYVDAAGTAKIIVLLVNNSLEIFHMDVIQKNSGAVSMMKLKIPGHRSDVRTVCFSSDNTAVLSASSESLKIWNRSTAQCIRTVECDYSLCSLFAPGHRHAVLGTKSGKLQIFDIAAGLLIESIEAHEGSVWSICLSPDKRSIVSGGADQVVKFWDFELIDDENTSSKKLTLVHTRTLKMSEDVLCVKLSPDGKFIAVALLDNTVKVFFVDSLKFFLSLYGHKLPVLCMDISSDSTLLVTGSADRNIKIWGLDFGDCHKSIFAHDDSIMNLQFLPNTHSVFSCGRDGKIKQWDADTFQHICTLTGHHAEVWCLAVSPSGNFIVTGSHDRSLRLWEKTDEPLILSEEREMERERADEEVTEEEVVAGEAKGETALAGKKTIDTVRSVEKLIEALDIHKDHDPSGKLHPILEATRITDPSKYVLEVLSKIRSSELEESLLVLPFSYVDYFLDLLNKFLEQELNVELCCRSLFFLLRIHQGQITSNQMLLPILSKLKISTLTSVSTLRDTVGFNLSGLNFMKKMIEDKNEVVFFSDATTEFKNRKKRSRVIIAR